VSRNPVQNAALDWSEELPPPEGDSVWAKFDYLKLRQTLESIVAAMEATVQAETPAEDAEIIPDDGEPQRETGVQRRDV
jgi:hypothetical protein